MQMLLVVVVLFILFAIIIDLTVESKHVNYAVQVNDDLNALKKEIFLSTTSSILNYETIYTFGVVRGNSKSFVDSNEDFKLAEKEALLEVLNEAKKLEANAIIGLKFNTGSYARAGSKWNTSSISWYFDFCFIMWYNLLT